MIQLVGTKSVMHIISVVNCKTKSVVQITLIVQVTPTLCNLKCQHWCRQENPGVFTSSEMKSTQMHAAPL